MRKQERFPIYVGGERFRTTVKMHLQTVGLIVAVMSVFYVFILLGLYDLVVDKNEHNIIVAKVKASWFASANNNNKVQFVVNGDQYAATASQIESDEGVMGIMDSAQRKLKLIFFLSIFIAVPVAYYFVSYIRKKADAFSTKHVRGPQLVSEKDIRKSIKKQGLEVSIPLSETVKMPVQDEIMNILVSGAPGSGKTQLFSRVFESVRKRNCKIICHDFKGDYVERFYDPTRDKIFNPLDSRSLPWRIFKEIDSIMDLQAVSHSLIPMSGGEQQFFNDAAREVFSGLLRYAYMEKRTRNRDIWEIVSSEIKSQLEMLIKAEAKAAAAYIDEAGAKNQNAGIKATLMQYTSSFEYMQNIDTDEDFSLSGWLNDGKGGAIFITNYVNCRDALRPILSLVIDLLARRLLSLPDNLTNRVFFLLDEFPELQPLSSIERLLTTARSKGGSVWIGIQDISQIRKRYGKEGAQTILNACGTSLVFRSPDPDTGEYFSRRIGECEYEHYASNFSISPEDLGDRQQMTMHNMRERLISPAEIQRMDNLDYYVTMIGRDVFKTRLRYKSYPSVNASFIMRPGMDIGSWLPQSQTSAKDAKKLDCPTENAPEPENDIDLDK